MANKVPVDEDEEDVCRICRNPGDADNPLQYPCACKGSIKFVHQHCLVQWLNRSKAQQCEVCKHPFSFSPLYAENTPAKLPLQELVVWISMKACHVLRFFLRLSFVLSVWLVIVPLITFWIWRLSFVTSFNEAHMLFLNHISTTVILTDCLHGFLLCASIVVFIVLIRTCAPVARGPPNRNLGENVAARREMQAARLEAHVPQMFDGLGDVDGAENVPFDVLFGMQGPLFHFVDTAFAVLAINMICIGVMILVPFHLGQFTSHHFSWILSSAKNPLLSTVVLLKRQAGSLANITLENIPTEAANLTSDDHHNNTMIGHVGLVESSNNIIQVETTQASSWLSDGTTLAVGYICIFSVVILYYGTVAVIRYIKGEPLVMWRRYRITPLFKQFLTAMKQLMTIVKVAFLLVLEVWVFPLMCGWWLDICTIRMFGKSISQRVEFFSELPFLSLLIHCMLGTFYVLEISSFVNLLRGVLRNGVLNFLADPNYKPFLYFLRGPAYRNHDPIWDLINDPLHKHALRFLLSVAVDGSSIVMLIYLPAKLAMRVAPSVFPLDILAYEDPASMLLFQIYAPFAFNNFKRRTTIKSLLHCWFTTVGWALGLTDFLLPKPEANVGQENGNQDPVRQDRLHARPVEQDRVLVGFMNEPSDSERNRFVLCIVLLLSAAWITLLIFNSMIITVPISLGRVLFSAITRGMKCNDRHSFVIGSYIILTVLDGARYSIDQIETRRATVLLGQLRKWCSIVVKSSLLLSIGIFVIPLLIGLLFKLLVIEPMLVPMDESPLFYLYRDWAFGLLFLYIWAQFVMLDLMILPPSWRVKFEKVMDDGFSRLEGLWVLREIVIPIVMKLLTALCFPYVLARGVFPVFGYPLVVNSAVYRYAWLGYLGFCLMCFCVKRLHAWFPNLHNCIRDDLYLIGRRLHNFGEDDHQEIYR